MGLWPSEINVWDGSKPVYDDTETSAHLPLGVDDDWRQRGARMPSGFTSVYENDLSETMICCQECWKFGFSNEKGYISCNIEMHRVVSDLG